jgi:hypothetical protein
LRADGDGDPGWRQAVLSRGEVTAGERELMVEGGRGYFLPWGPSRACEIGRDPRIGDGLGAQL